APGKQAREPGASFEADLEVCGTSEPRTSEPRGIGFMTDVAQAASPGDFRLGAAVPGCRGGAEAPQSKIENQKSKISPDQALRGASVS
ncbi:MAG: hypothetical protein LBC18_04960, partial [Opitutaceae bacterium]|nr:hypothetical protein [Opitutaceae bacterium]